MDVEQHEEEAEAQKPYADKRHHAKVKAERSQRKEKVAVQADDKSDTPKRPSLAEGEEENWEADSQSSEWGHRW